MIEEKNSTNYPFKLDLEVRMYGKSFPVWVYDSAPEGMRRITTMADLWPGRAFLFRSQFSDEYLTGYMRPSVLPAVRYMLEKGIPVYVKD